MSSDCPLKGEQCIKRFQNQAFWGLHSFGTNFAVISPSWVKCMKEGGGKWGCLRGILPRHWSKSGFINKENKTWNLTYIAKKNGSTASYSIFSEHKSKLIDLQDFSEQWSKVQVKRALVVVPSSSSGNIDLCIEYRYFCTSVLLFVVYTVLINGPIGIRRRLCGRGYINSGSRNSENRGWPSKNRGWKPPFPECNSLSRQIKG